MVGVALMTLALAAIAAAATVNVDLKLDPHIARGSAKDGDTVRICNKSDIDFKLFSITSGNAFKDVMLKPGQCLTRTVHNSSSKTVKYLIFNQFNSERGVIITIAPATATPKGPDLSGNWVFHVTYGSGDRAWEETLDYRLTGPPAGPWHVLSVVVFGGRGALPGTKDSSCVVTRQADGKIAIVCGQGNGYCPGMPEGGGFAGTCSGYRWELRRRP